MNLTDYGKKYDIHPETVKRYVSQGIVRGEKLTDGGAWFIHDEPPVRVIEDPKPNPVRETPKTRDIINSINYLVNREVLKITSWSESIDKTLPMGTLRTVSDLMDKLTRLRREDNTVLKNLQLTKMTDEFLAELIEEAERRDKLEAESNVARIDREAKRAKALDPRPDAWRYGKRGPYKKSTDGPQDERPEDKKPRKVDGPKLAYGESADDTD